MLAVYDSLLRSFLGTSMSYSTIQLCRVRYGDKTIVRHAQEKDE